MAVRRVSSFNTTAVEMPRATLIVKKAGSVADLHVSSHRLTQSEFPPADRALEVLAVRVHDDDVFLEVGRREKAFGAVRTEKRTIARVTAIVHLVTGQLGEATSARLTTERAFFRMRANVSLQGTELVKLSAAMLAQVTVPIGIAVTALDVCFHPRE